MAGFPLPRLAAATSQIADPDRLHYGSDWPFTPLDTVTHLAGELDATPLLGDTLRQRIFLDNSLALFPRLAQQWKRGGRAMADVSPPHLLRRPATA